MKKILLILLVFLFCPSPILAVNTIDINTASLQQLDELAGIGPALAQKIIDARPYASIDDLLNVKGIGEKTLQEIKNQGLAYVLTEPQAPSAHKASNAPMPQPVVTVTPKPITYPKGIIINEILPSPEGPDETNEFVELYNSNAVPVNISGWKIKDTVGTTTTYTLPKGSGIPANGYLVLKRPTTKISLHNNQDGVSLLFPNGNISDEISYSAATPKQSYNRTDADWQWNGAPTPGAKNNQTLPNLPKTDNTIHGASSNVDKKMFKASLQQGALNPWWLFIAASAIATISGILFLLLKLNVFKKDERS